MQFSKMIPFWPELRSRRVVERADVRFLEEIVAKVNGDIITRSELAKGRKRAW